MCIDLFIDIDITKTSNIDFVIALGAASRGDNIPMSTMNNTVPVMDNNQVYLVIKIHLFIYIILYHAQPRPGAICHWYTKTLRALAQSLVRHPYTHHHYKYLKCTLYHRYPGTKYIYIYI
jgi:hypothetical protein